MPTYQDHYEEHLERLMAKGGKVEEMNAAVNEMNLVGGNVFKPTPLYRTWLDATTSLKCGDCGDAFKPEGVPDVKTEAVCTTCAARRAQAVEDEQ